MKDDLKLNIACTLTVFSSIGLSFGHVYDAPLLILASAGILFGAGIIIGKYN